MLLHPGESILRSAHAVLDPADDGPSSRAAGVLYLTNQRLVFEAPVSRGVVRDLVDGPDVSLVLDTSLRDLRNLSIRRGRLRGDRLVVDLAREKPAFDVLQPEQWVEAISEARRGLPAAGAPPAAVSTHVIERQVVKIRCRYCGTLGTEGDPRCPFCGAAL
jgi:hypothetical protein